MTTIHVIDHHRDVHNEIATTPPPPPQCRNNDVNPYFGCHSTKEIKNFLVPTMWCCAFSLPHRNATNLLHSLTSCDICSPHVFAKPMLKHHHYHSHTLPFPCLPNAISMTLPLSPFLTHLLTHTHTHPTLVLTPTQKSTCVFFWSPLQGLFFIFHIKKDREKEKEAQPSTLLTTRGNEEDAMNYILQQKMCTQEKTF